MDATRWIFLWPGLAGAWHRGSPQGLFFAVLFSWAVCLALLATFVWPAWIAVWTLRSLWGLILVSWLAGCMRGLLVGGLSGRVSPRESHWEFCSAQREYLKGNWFEAEATLLKITHDDPDDVAAGLLLVGVLRHTRRWRPALRRLEQLSLLDAARAWQFEIVRERQLIERGVVSGAAAESAGEMSGADNQSP